MDGANRRLAQAIFEAERACVQLQMTAAWNARQAQTVIDPDGIWSGELLNSEKIWRATHYQRRAAIAHERAWLILAELIGAKP